MPDYVTVRKCTSIQKTGLILNTGRTDFDKGTRKKRPQEKDLIHMLRRRSTNNGHKMQGN